MIMLSFINCYALDNGKLPGKTPPEGTPPVVSWKEVKGIHDWNDAASHNILWIIKAPQPDNYTTTLWYVMALVQVSINWLLWILSTVALVYMLYCGFLIFSSGADDKNTSKGKKWIKTAAIALAWIWLSWLIISAMIWLITVVVWDK